MITNSASWVLDTGCGAHIYNDLQLLERSRKLSKDEVVLKHGDGKVVTTEAIGILRLAVSDQANFIMVFIFSNSMISSSLLKTNIKWKIKKTHISWYPRLSHISQDRIKRLVDSTSLEIDDLDHLPACESCLKRKMTKKPFVGQSTLVSCLLDLIYSDVCGPLNTQVGGGFFYFITFADDHSRYGYVYLMRYKYEAFGRFKEFRLEVENQTDRKIKTFDRTEVVSI
ncbi:UNVERIFIED_CONTAM: Retrovirus-related Pol polyprotein from transposon TNT 1-94 [Sesamum indicum]